MVRLSKNVVIPETEYSFQPIRSAGPGGQNVNKVSSAVQLFFDVKASSLPEFYKSRILALKDRRLTAEGVVVIRAQEHRSQEKNKAEALRRLRELIAKATRPRKKRRPTQPSLASKKRKIESSKRRSRIKNLRKRPDL